LHELLFERAAVGHDYQSRDCVQQNPVGLRHQIRAPKEDATGLVYQGLRTAYAHEPLQFILQRLGVTWWMVIQHHQVKNETLQAQVLVASQKPPNKVQVVLLSDPNESNRQIAADAVGPQSRLISGVELEHV
jgi:hypothetical protein